MSSARAEAGAAARRIIYLNPFGKSQISGGIKTSHRHVEMLVEMGYDAHVWQPDGRPDWFRSAAPMLDEYSQARMRAGDVLIFPETLESGPLGAFMAAGVGCTKVLFCQNQYYSFNKWVPSRSYAEMGFDGVICCSLSSQRFLEDVLGVQKAAVIPCFVDRELFRPLEKKPQVAVVLRKAPEKAWFIARCFHAQFPEYRHVRFAGIDKLGEADVARVLGESAFLLSMSQRESFGLVPVEAMSAGCLVAGFHGHGGLEYATGENGLWFGSDDEVAVAGALGRLVGGYLRGEPWVDRMRENGLRTAERYSLEATGRALDGYFSALGVRKAARS